MSGALVTGPVAASEPGLYLALRGGPNALAEVDARFGDIAVIDLDYEAGWHVGGAIGWQARPQWPARFRIEAELAHQHHELQGGTIEGLDIPFAELGIDRTRGTGRITSLMVNVYADFDLGLPLYPFLGAGMGAARVSLDDIGGRVFARLPVVGEISASGTIADDSDLVAAVQGIAGLGWDLTERVSAALSYRVFLTSQARLDIDVPLIDETEVMEGQLLSQAVRLELRYRF